MVFSNRIYAAVQYDYPVNYGLATALGVSFVALMLILIYWQNRLLRGRDYSVVTGKGYKPRVVRLGRFRYVTLAFCLLYFGIATAPAAVAGLHRLVPEGLRVAEGGPVHLRQLPGHPQRRDAVARVDQHLHRVRRSGRDHRGAVRHDRLRHHAHQVIGRRPLEVVSWLPWAIPGIVTGLGMLWAYIILSRCRCTAR